MRFTSAIIILIGILLESIFISYPLTFLSVLMISLVSEKDVILLAFLAGLLLDIFSLKVLGSDSLYFLSVLYIGQSYRKKIYEKAFIYNFFFFLISFMIYDFLFYKQLNIFRVLFAALIIILLLAGIDKIFFIKNKKRLEV